MAIEIGQTRLETAEIAQIVGGLYLENQFLQRQATVALQEIGRLTAALAASQATPPIPPQHREDDGS